MLRDKPHLGFSVFAIISGLMAIISKYLFMAKSHENSILYWLGVLFDGVPMLFVSFLFLAVAYWVMAFFRRDTHPVLNVLQMLFVLFSYIGISYVAGAMLHTSAFPYFSIFDYFIILSPYFSLFILVFNIIYSLIKPSNSQLNII